MVQYRDGKEVPPKEEKKYSKKDYSRAFVRLLKKHLQESVADYKTIPKKEIPKKLKTIIDQLHINIKNFLRNYEMTEAIVNVKDGKILTQGNQPLEELKFEVMRLNKEYKEEHGHAKSMPHKFLVGELESLNKTRQDEGLQPLKIISSRTYDEWKKQSKAQK